MPPSIQDEVPFSDIAQFNCSGVGSYIRIKWRFNNSIICDASSCDSDLLSYRQENTSDIGNNFTIDSSLLIDTSQSQEPLFGDTFNVECRVEQRIPPELNLRGEDRVFITNMTLFPTTPPPTFPTPPPTFQTFPTHPTTTPGNVVKYA